MEGSYKNAFEPLHPSLALIKSDGGFIQECLKELHPFLALIKSDGGFIQECLKELHPFLALIKSDGGCHSQANRESLRDVRTLRQERLSECGMLFKIALNERLDEPDPE